MQVMSFFFFQKIKQKELQLLMVRYFCSLTTIHCIYAMYKTIAVMISTNIIASSFLKLQYGFYYNTDFRPNILWVLYPKKFQAIFQCYNWHYEHWMLFIFPLDIFFEKRQVLYWFSEFIVYFLWLFSLSLDFINTRYHCYTQFQFAPGGSVCDAQLH